MNLVLARPTLVLDAAAETQRERNSISQLHPGKGALGGHDVNQATSRTSKNVPTEITRKGISPHFAIQ